MSLGPIHPCALERALSTMMYPITRLFNKHIAFPKVMIASDSRPTFILSWSGSTELSSTFIAHQIVGIKTPRLNSALVVFIEIETRKNNNTFRTYRLDENVIHELTAFRWTWKCKVACHEHHVCGYRSPSVADEALSSGKKHLARGMEECLEESTRWGGLIWRRKAWRERRTGHDLAGEWVPCSW